MTGLQIVALQKDVQDLFLENRVVVGEYQYTRPAVVQYEHQWLWDSCFHAIVLKHFDPEAARKELLSLVVHQVLDGPDAGMIPHMTYWNGGAEDIWGEVSRSTITQPPLLAVAAFDVWKVTRDFDLLEGLYQHLLEYHKWFDRRRDIHGDGLVAIVHPWESGWDASPRWDAQLSKDGSGDAINPEWRIQHMQTVASLGWNARQIAAAGHFCVQPLDFNAMRLADIEALARIAAVLEFQEDTLILGEQAQFIRFALREKMWSSKDTTFYDLTAHSQVQIEEASASSAVALFGGVATDEQANHIVRELRSPRFSLPFGVPTTPRSHPLFDPNVYWRGNIWPSVTWLLHKGLKRYAFDFDARLIARSFGQLVERNGFHEYFNPITGEGLGPKKQTWTALVLDLLISDGALVENERASDS